MAHNFAVLLTRRLAPWARRAALTAALVAGGGCFDYDEQLTVAPDGSVSARLRYLLPQAVSALPEMQAGFYPSTPTAIASRVGVAIDSVNDNYGSLIGFDTTVSDVSALDTGFIRRSFEVTDDGHFRFVITLDVAPRFADTVSAEVARYTTDLPLGPARRERIRQASLERFGLRFGASLPAEVQDTNGVAAGKQVRWKVPLAKLATGGRIELHASGKLTAWQRLRRKLR